VENHVAIGMILIRRSPCAVSLGTLPRCSAV